jgi:hypothetical protein
MRHDCCATDSINRTVPRAQVLLRAPLGQRVGRLSALLALAIISAGCASTQAPADSGLAGQWQLDAVASDNVEARVKQSIDRAEARERERLRSGYGAVAGMRTGPAGSEAGSDSGGPYFPTPRVGPDFAQLRAHLLQILAAPMSLSLQVQPDSVTVQSDRLPARSYQPGESFVRFDEYGNATVSSGWSGNAFFVRQRYLGRGTLTERYEVDPKSGMLTYTRALKDPTVGSIELKSIYHHG